jgi:hypothetical protein
MMKKLLKNLTLSLILCASSLTFGQIDVTFTDPGTLELATDGTLSGGTISFTVVNIPLNTPNMLTIRVYKKIVDFPTNTYNKPGFVAVDTTYPLDSGEADATLTNYSYTTAVNATNPTTHIDRTFTIINVPLTTDPIAEGVEHAITLRFINAGPAGSTPIPGSFVSPPASIEGGAGKHAMHELHTLSVPAALGLNKSHTIPGAIVHTNDNSISISGANLDAVYTITGQKVGTINLSKGVYIVKMSKGDKTATVKIAL